MRNISFFDLEVDSKTNSIFDIGCYRWDGSTFHENSIQKFTEFIKGSNFIAGHNILAHDLKHIRQALGEKTFGSSNAIDTLYLSPLLFPSRPYHRLLKDDKLNADELNNPVNDAIKAKELFYEEVSAFQKLDESLKKIFISLLSAEKEFACFFNYLNLSNGFSDEETETLIRSKFLGKICENARLNDLIQNSKIALAYSLALVSSSDKYSITPPWVLHNFPDIERVLFLLRAKPCQSGDRKSVV